MDTVVVELRDALGSLASAALAGTSCTLPGQSEAVALVQASIEIYAQFAAVVGQPEAAQLNRAQLSAAAGQVSYPRHGMPVLGPIPECDGLF